MSLLSNIIQVFKETRKTIKKGSEIGSSGTTIIGGVLSDQDHVPELTGEDAITTYNKMRKSDGVVKAALLACTLPIRATNWYVKPASDEKIDVEIAEYIEHNLFEAMSITWDDTLRQALLMLPYGHMAFEKVFSTINFNGKEYVGWKKFAPRLPQTIQKWATEDGQDGITQNTDAKGDVSIPMDKLLIFVNDKEGDNWEGISVLRSAYRSWYFKNHIEKINAIAFERQGLGVPTIKLPESYTAEDKTKAEELLKNMRANEQAYLILPNGWEFEFVSPKGNEVKDPTATINRYNREILISVLAQFLDLGSGPQGSRALSADHSTTFHNNLTAIAKQIKDVINKYAIQQLVDLNFNVQNYPTLEFSKIGLVDYVKLSSALKTLIDSNVIKPDAQTEDYLREVMNLPERQEEEQEEKKKSKPDPKPEKEKKEAREPMMFWEPFRPLTFAEKKVRFKAINKTMDTSEDRLRKKIKKALKKGESDFLKQIASLLSETDRSIRQSKISKLVMKYKDEYKNAIESEAKEAFEIAKTMAAHEMKQPVPATTKDIINNMAVQADALTKKMNAEVVTTAKENILLSAQQGKTKPQILAVTTKAVKKKVRKFWENTPPVIVSGSVNQGRRLAFNTYKDKIYALQRSEILDSTTCTYCLSIDSRVCKKNDPFTRTDSIHNNCRGIWVEIMKEEPEKPKIDGIPKSLRKRFGLTINDVKQPKKPIVRKDSYVSKNRPELLNQ